MVGVAGAAKPPDRKSSSVVARGFAVRHNRKHK
jgi:hypothetical protein